MISIAIIVLYFVSIVVSKDVLRYNIEDAPTHFESFIETYNKEYADEDEKAKRYQIFLNNLEEINILNEKYELTQYGINQFSDLTSEEFIQNHTGYLGEALNGQCTYQIEISNETKHNITTDSGFDWRNRGVVSEVKSQGKCGGCWAFSAIGNVESVYAIKTGQMVDLSEQQLIDCDTRSSGCTGGFPYNALAYLIDNGANSEYSYPYTEMTGQCSYNPANVAVRISGCANINEQREDQLSNKLSQIAPLSIGIDASSLQSHMSGIIQDCGHYTLNHAVLLVGYGTENGIDYWIIKNSWGPQWGENGYFRIQRGVNCLGLMQAPPVTAII